MGHLDDLRRHGTDAVSFQALESSFRWWRDPAVAASVAYVDTGRSWIAVGTPLAEPGDRAHVARQFARDANAHHRRAVFIAVENLRPFDGFRRVALGLQSMLPRATWTETFHRNRKLREQLRRARAKGVTVRRVAPDELVPDAPLRTIVEQLGERWLRSRPMEPMAFLVAVEPFHAPDEHIYLIAERHGRAVQFLSALPIYQRGGWLVEDVLRDPSAPNGTTELLLDRLMQELDPDTGWFTPGLTPLAGDITWWLRLARFVSTPLYDFDGLRRFRARLSPPRWDPVWMVWDRGWAPLVLLDVLRAFANGHLVRFAWRTLVRHPNGPPWAIAVPLVVWTALLIGLVAGGHTSVLGFSTLALTGWIVFDIVLAWQLFRASRQPRPVRLMLLAGAAAADAIASIQHLAAAGLGSGWLAPVLRTLATAGPVIGTLALGWAAYLAHGRRRR